MKRNKQDYTDLELMKSHFIVSVIRTQEQADQALEKCKELESMAGDKAEASRCRETAKSLQRQANCYMRKYQMLKKRQQAGER